VSNRSSTQVIGGSLAYRRMRDKELTPEEAAAELKLEAQRMVRQEIERAGRTLKAQRQAAARARRARLLAPLRDLLGR
jgi:hypothetical protein